MASEKTQKIKVEVVVHVDRSAWNEEYGTFDLDLDRRIQITASIESAVKDAAFRHLIPQVMSVEVR